MYLTWIALPLLSALISALLGRKIGKKGSQIISCITISISTILGIIGFYEVCIASAPVSIELTNWINLELLQINWGLNWDSLTVAMLLPVLIVSTAVNIYSIGYMSEDPHNQRFFCAPR